MKLWISSQKCGAWTMTMKTWMKMMILPLIVTACQMTAVLPQMFIQVQNFNFISDAAMNIMVKFLSTLLEVLGQFSPFVSA